MIRTTKLLTSGVSSKLFKYTLPITQHVIIQRTLTTSGPYLLIPMLKTNSPTTRTSVLNKSKNYMLFSASVPKEAPILENGIEIITKEQLQQKLANKQKLQNKSYLIDVREGYEYANAKIETAVNLPLSQIEAAIKLTPEEFQKKYNFPKLQVTDEIITYCRSGVRAQKAAILFKKLGYQQVKNYKGSALEWIGKDIVDRVPFPK